MMVSFRISYHFPKVVKRHLNSKNPNLTPLQATNYKIREILLKMNREKK